MIYATAQKAEIKAKTQHWIKRLLENLYLTNGVACPPMKEKFGRTKQLLKKKPLKKNAVMDIFCSNGYIFESV